MSYKSSFRECTHYVGGKLFRAGIIRSLLSVILFSFIVSGCKKTELTDPSSADQMKAAGIEQITPANQASDVVLNPMLSVTFKNGTDPSVVQSSVLTLKCGSSTVDGKMTVSGMTATFKPANDLIASGDYTAVISTAKSGSKGGDHTGDYTWRFRTGDHNHYDLKVASVIPLNGSTDIPVTTSLTITFNQELSRGMKSAISVVLKSGTTVTQGTLSFNDNKAFFKPSANLTAGSVYNVNVITGSTGHDDHESDHSYNWSFTTAGAGAADVTPPTVLSVVPAVNATSVAVTGKLTVNFSENMTASTVNATTFTLSQGATPVAGTVVINGATATFTPAAPLANNTLYTAAVTTGVKDAAGNALAAAYSWGFTTVAAAPSDVTPPTVLSVVPVSGATSIAVNSAITATFSEALNASTVNSTTFTVLQGTTAVSGTVSYTGVTAKFTPSAALTNNIVYTVTVGTGVKDVAGNSLAAAKVWSFTTVAAAPSDVTPPTVLTVVPASGATMVAVTSNITATFSEALNASTVNSATFTVMQGTTSVPGTVSYSGVTATFTPTSALANNTVYSITITTGVKDVAGNSLAAAKVWSFTTVPAMPAGMSFANDVVPVLNMCNNCHTHGWTTSTNASTFYTNLSTAGYVNAASPTTSKIYVKLNSGHPGSSISTADINKILTWMNEGTKNN